MLLKNKLTLMAAVRIYASRVSLFSMKETRVTLHGVSLPHVLEYNVTLCKCNY